MVTFALSACAAARGERARAAVSTWAGLMAAANGTNGTIVLSAPFSMDGYDPYYPLRIGGRYGKEPQNLVIEGNGAVLDAGHATQGKLIDVSSTTSVRSKLELRNITMTGGNTEGGAIRGGGSDVIIRDCTFTDNSPAGDYTSTRGGAISASGLFQIYNTTFTGNMANGGGAIFACCSDSRVEIYSSLFTGNRALAGGGAIMADRATVMIHDSTFTQNTAPAGQNGGGGAVGAYYHSSVHISGSTFTAGGGKIGQNDIHRDGSDGQDAEVTFECPSTAAGKPVEMKGADLSTSQLPPAKQVVHCK